MAVCVMFVQCFVQVGPLIKETIGEDFALI